MANQTHALVASKPFALICSYQVPTTQPSPDFVPSISVVIGHYESQEQAKQARQAIQHAALISAWCYHKFEDDCSSTATNKDTDYQKTKAMTLPTSQPLNINTYQSINMTDYSRSNILLLLNRVIFNLNMGAYSHG